MLKLIEALDHAFGTLLPCINFQSRWLMHNQLTDASTMAVMLF